jgi:hypothetical protein
VPSATGGRGLGRKPGNDLPTKNAAVLVLDGNESGQVVEELRRQVVALLAVPGAELPVAAVLGIRGAPELV